MAQIVWQVATLYLKKHKGKGSGDYHYTNFFTPPVAGVSSKVVKIY